MKNFKSHLHLGLHAIAITIFSLVIQKAYASGDCASTDLRKASPHFICSSSTGAIFERVEGGNFGESWKGPDDLIWSDRILEDKYPYDHDHYEAINICRDLGGRLPTLEEFVRAEENGFREILPNIKNIFWLGTLERVDPKDAIFARAYVFNGDTGGVALDRRNDLKSFRCVRR